MKERSKELFRIQARAVARPQPQARKSFGDYARLDYSRSKDLDKNNIPNWVSVIVVIFLIVASTKEGVSSPFFPFKAGEVTAASRHAKIRDIPEHCRLRLVSEEAIAFKDIGKEYSFFDRPPLFEAKWPDVGVVAVTDGRVARVKSHADPNVSNIGGGGTNVKNSYPDFQSRLSPRYGNIFDKYPGTVIFKQAHFFKSGLAFQQIGLFFCDSRLPIAYVSLAAKNPQLPETNTNQQPIRKARLENPIPYVLGYAVVGYLVYRAGYWFEGRKEKRYPHKRGGH